MKKTTFFSLCLGLSSILMISEAFQPTTVLDQGIVDDVIAAGRSASYYFQESGAIYLLFNGSNKTQGMGFGIAIPCWLGKYSLYKISLQKSSFRRNIPMEDSIVYGRHSVPETAIIKFGLSGRQIINAKVILGLYGSYDTINFEKVTNDSIPSLLNTGIEIIAPRYANLTLDAVCKPHTLLRGKSIDRFYQVSTRLSLAKPRILDIGLALAVTKYVNTTAHKWHAVVDCKGSFPVKTWHINKHVLIGGGLVYDKKPALAWSSVKNLYLSLYAQIDCLPQKTNNSFHDYLKMPVDRFLGLPYHPTIYHLDWAPTDDDDSRSTGDDAIHIADCKEDNSPKLTEMEPIPMSDS